MHPKCQERLRWPELSYFARIILQSQELGARTLSPLLRMWPDNMLVSCIPKKAHTLEPGNQEVRPETLFGS